MGSSLTTTSHGGQVEGPEDGPCSGTAEAFLNGEGQVPRALFLEGREAQGSTADCLGPLGLM